MTLYMDYGNLAPDIVEPLTGGCNLYYKPLEVMAAP
jgi:hypothetical protein